MTKYIDKFSPEEYEIWIQKMKKQAELDELADVEYECYCRRITPNEFWKQELRW